MIALNVVVYLITGAAVARRRRTTPAPARCSSTGSWCPAGRADTDQYDRLITSAFLHVSLLHIAFNMIALYIIGPPLERLLGPWRFVAVYLLGALGGSGR